MTTYIHTATPPSNELMSLDLDEALDVFGLASWQNSALQSADLCPASQLEEKPHWPPKVREPLPKIRDPASCAEQLEH